MEIKRIIREGVVFILSSIAPKTKVYPQISYLSPNNLLKGRTALITGGTSGIGYEIAKTFINAGASVIITGRNNERIERAKEKLLSETKTDNVFGLQLDNSLISDFPEKLSAATKMVNTPIDILVNNAGILGQNLGNDLEYEYDSVMNTNLKGMFFLSNLVAQYMIDHSIRGNILNIASSSSLRPAINAYTLSKWGVRSLTLGLAKKLIPHGIVVNGVAPGPTATPMMIKEGTRNLSLPNNPSGRFTTPEEVANISLILVSNMGRQIVGDIIYISGGAGVITYDDIQY